MGMGGARRFTVDAYEEAFERDGSLRDLYVLSTSRDDWSAFLKFVSASQYANRFKLNDSPAPLPPDASSLFPRSGDNFPLLRIDVSGMGLNCHFYLENEIELDLDPREVQDDAKADAIVAFIAALGDALGKEVRMTSENGPDEAILRYDPSAKNVSYVPPPHRV